MTNGMLQINRMTDTNTAKSSQQRTKENMNAIAKSRLSVYRMWQYPSEPTIGHQNHQVTKVR